MALGVRYQHPRGTAASFATLVAANGLLPGELYLITDTQNACIATSTNTYITITTLPKQNWVINFAAAGDVYIAASVAMTVDTGNADLGTGTMTYAKSTAAAPSTFNTTTLPATLEAGAWLKATAAGVTGFKVKHLIRTA